MSFWTFCSTVSLFRPLRLISFRGWRRGSFPVTYARQPLQRSITLRAKFSALRKADEHISKVLSLFEVAAVNRPVLEEALKSKFPDFEDAVIYQAARYAGVHGLVTRDMQGFKRAKIPVYSPEELTGIIERR